jgi:hypothetical protein
MREIRLSGSEGGEPGPLGFSYPYQTARQKTTILIGFREPQALRDRR